MNWEAISAIGEIVGALAVVITLVYLAIQIREQNRESRAAAIDSLSQLWGGLMSDLSASETLSDIYLRGLADFDGLSPSEKNAIHHDSISNCANHGVSLQTSSTGPIGPGDVGRIRSADARRL